MIDVINKITNYFLDDYEGEDETAPMLEFSVFELREIADIFTDLCHTKKELYECKSLKEQDKLIKLPCKIGDTLWQILITGAQGAYIEYNMYKVVVTRISFEENMKFSMTTLTTDGYRNEVSQELIGDTVFFSESDAEARLKELRGAETKYFD